MNNSFRLLTIAHQAPLFMGFSRQEHWSGLPSPPPGDPPDAGIEPTSLMSPALAGGFFTTSITWEAHLNVSARFSSVQSLSHVRLCATPWTAAHQAPLSMGFSRQEYWSGLPFPSPVESISSVQFSRSVVSDCLQSHESKHARPPCPSPTPRVYPNSCPSSR